MADNVLIAADDTALLAALDAIPDACLAHLKPESKVTADNIASEAGRRVRRRTGRTGEAITVEETRNGDGYVVFVGGDRGHIGRYLEFGTRGFQHAHPFLFVSARLEEGPNLRRARLAIQDAIDEKGLGE
jgi:murein DD-endopeptidase MepM/ murein hydrolase activator NlpD